MIKVKRYAFGYEGYGDGVRVSCEPIHGQWVATASSATDRVSAVADDPATAMERLKSNARLKMAVLATLIFSACAANTNRTRCVVETWHSDGYMMSRKIDNNVGRSTLVTAQGYAYAPGNVLTIMRCEP